MTTGLGILAGGMGVVVAAGAIMLVLVAVVTLAAIPPESGGFLFCCPLSLAGLGAVVQLVGMFFTCTAPPVRGLKTWAVVGAVGSLLAGPVGYALYLVFLVKLAREVGRPGLGRGFLVALVLALVLPLCGCPFFFIFGTRLVDGTPVSNAAAPYLQLALFLATVALTGGAMFLALALRRALLSGR